MERLTVTTLDHLKEGDTFYRAGDKNKKVCEVVEINYKFGDTVDHVVIKFKGIDFTSKTISYQRLEEYRIVFLKHKD